MAYFDTSNYNYGLHNQLKMLKDYTVEGSTDDERRERFACIYSIHALSSIPQSLITLEKRPLITMSYLDGADISFINYLRGTMFADSSIRQSVRDTALYVEDNFEQITWATDTMPSPSRMRAHITDVDKNSGFLKIMEEDGVDMQILIVTAKFKKPHTASIYVSRIESVIKNIVVAIENQTKNIPNAVNKSIDVCSSIVVAHSKTREVINDSSVKKSPTATCGEAKMDITEYWIQTTIGQTDPPHNSLLSQLA